MEFEYSPDLKAYIAEVDKFITSVILPLQHKDDNNRFFDHRREPSRTLWDKGGLPNPEWEQLLTQARKLAYHYISKVMALFDTGVHTAE